MFLVVAILGIIQPVFVNSTSPYQDKHSAVGPAIDFSNRFVGRFIREFMHRDKKEIKPSVHAERNVRTARGIAHQDLKPENVLLTRGNPLTAKVADFGLAKVADSKTFLKTRCGTEAYVAPEVLIRKDQDPYSDLVDAWSVGVIAFYMLTGENLFIDDHSIKNVKKRISRRRIWWPYLRGVNPSNNAMNLIAGLLQRANDGSMSVSEARDHPWFVEFGPLAPQSKNPEQTITRASTSTTVADLHNIATVPGLLHNVTVSDVNDCTEHVKDESDGSLDEPADETKDIDTRKRSWVANALPAPQVGFKKWKSI
ncbi:kinase-like protein [Coniophora puteana RWD-64-598 SS2]|uniref:Kinase-like protein n=1 Tax=Coniophora puteana (strain RWD-64-598) TaxID=741705 RepID=A0A5M3M7V9_CONPW|nr:kinase-like protein [Coniophora puteana RWD-64-598 SS2]EIW75362.1 kinase-like protein [Coniophora puteana RWD-64-598 SS2]